jgi:hypothetical protein
VGGFLNYLPVLKSSFSAMLGHNWDFGSFPKYFVAKTTETKSPRPFLQEAGSLLR